jgi:ketosteroid isomerase-like protein
MRIGIALFFLLQITLTGCNSNRPSTLAPAPEAAIPDPDKWVQAYFAHFNRHDWAKMAALYADTADCKDPSLGPGIVKQTRQQTIAKYTALQQLIPDLHDSVVQVYPAGKNHLVVEFVSTGTGPDKKPFALPICTIFTIENGLITKDYTYYDNME